MSYKMTETTEQVFIGELSSGEFNLEVWDRPRSDPDAQCVEVFIPHDAAEEVAKYILRRT